MGRPQYDSHPPSSELFSAGLREVAGHATHAAARRLAHAALSIDHLRLFPKNGRLPGAGRRGVLSHADRPEQPSALPALRRRSPGLGRRSRDTYSPRFDGSDLETCASGTIKVQKKWEESENRGERASLTGPRGKAVEMPGDARLATGPSRLAPARCPDAGGLEVRRGDRRERNAAGPTLELRSRSVPRHSRRCSRGFVRNAR